MLAHNPCNIWEIQKNEEAPVKLPYDEPEPPKEAESSHHIIGWKREHNSCRFKLSCFLPPAISLALPAFL